MNIGADRCDELILKLIQDRARTIIVVIHGLPVDVRGDGDVRNGDQVTALLSEQAEVGVPDRVFCFQNTAVGPFMGRHRKQGSFSNNFSTLVNYITEQAECKRFYVIISKTETEKAAAFSVRSLICS